MRRISLAFLIIFCVLGFVARFPNIAYHANPAAHSDSADIRITKTLFFDSCFYDGRMMQDENGNIYVELIEHLVMIDTDNRIYYYHIPHSFPFDWNVIGDTIQIKKGKWAYEYAQDGTFLRRYPAVAFQTQFGSGLIERDGKFYEFFRTGQSIVGIKEQSISTGEERVILWSFSRKTYDILTDVLYGLQVITAVLFFVSLFFKKGKKADMYK